ncbi:hypothetical protein H4R33_005608 [Dimargaris cristalligena]|uniref:Uncharacterized protein n=1 Tax=Dimargaris cristalligena TaxID=215637 RepID=A0A4P9ZWQ8_9FUNG|nr:hypothetical protein H4R33_005608 [Dimargaris cristalligena]RKP38084.1 hypothetical protein BJ085DRAFT_29776 [Dimargaris cristalligena]|eukprot:RKP38084.1 hypothetical protein BJ085DRAFT_29776 [Dimargaris cristalligena]
MWRSGFPLSTSQVIADSPHNPFYIATKSLPTPIDDPSPVHVAPTQVVASPPESRAPVHVSQPPREPPIQDRSDSVSGYSTVSESIVVVGPRAATTSAEPVGDCFQGSQDSITVVSAQLTTTTLGEDPQTVATDTNATLLKLGAWSSPTLSKPPRTWPLLAYCPHNPFDVNSDRGRGSRPADNSPPSAPLEPHPSADPSQTHALPLGVSDSKLPGPLSPHELYDDDIPPVCGSFPPPHDEFGAPSESFDLPPPHPEDSDHPMPYFVNFQPESDVDQCQFPMDTGPEFDYSLYHDVDYQPDPILSAPVPSIPRAPDGSVGPRPSSPPLLPAASITTNPPSLGGTTLDGCSQTEDLLPTNPPSPQQELAPPQPLSMRPSPPVVSSKPAARTTHHLIPKIFPDIIEDAGRNPFWVSARSVTAHHLVSENT